jgi:phosphatidylglycerophosphate synthase
VIRLLGAQSAFDSLARNLPSSWSSRFLAAPGVAWLACSAGALAFAAIDEPFPLAGCLLASALFLGLERGFANRSPSPDGPARAFVTRTGEVAFASAVALILGWKSAAAADGAVSAWLCWAAAFAVVAQEYGAVVHARVVRSAGFGEPLALGVRAADGTVSGLADPLPCFLDGLRMPASEIGPWLAVLLFLDLPEAGLWALAGLAVAGSLWTNALRAIVIWRIEARSRTAPRPEPPGLHGRDRWKRLEVGLSAARDDAFWGLVVARPVVALWLYFLAEIRCLTPNRVTLVSTLACFAAGGLGMAGEPVLAWLAVGLIFVRSVLDSFDGQLARYRGLSSQFGSLVDKVSDAWGWAALYAAPAALGYARTGEAWALMVPLAGVTILYFQGITYWLSRDLRPGGTGRATEAPSPLTARGWVRNLWRIVLFEEPDYYFWISLGLLTGEWAAFALVVAIPTGARFLALNSLRLRDAWKAWNPQPQTEHP